MKEKIKRISSSTWALILALMMVVSSFSVLAATTNVNKTGSGYSAGETIYFSAGKTSWYGSEAKTVAYFYGNSDERYAVFQSAGNDKNYLKATVPDGTFTKMTLIRYNPSGSSFNTNGGEGWPGDAGIWNKIENITRSDSSYNLYTVNSDSLNAGEWSKYSASDPVATSVSLNPDNSTINVGDSLKLTASTTGKVNGNVTYTFYNGSTQVGEAQTTSESTATATVSGLSAGDYTFTVKVTKDGYTEVASDPINVTVTGGSGGSVSDDIISVLNGDKIMFYITVNSSWKPTSPLYVKEDASPYSIVAKLDNSNGAVTVPQAKYRLSNSSTWEGNQMSDVAVAGYKYRLDGTIGSTTSSGSATTTVNSDNTITTDFIAGQSGDGKKYTLVYYMKDSSDNYSKVGTSADEVNTKVDSLSYGTYTLYTCSTDGTITVLRDTDTIDIASPVAKSVTISADATEKTVGDDVVLTANVDDLVKGANNVKYTFQEVNEDGTTVVSTKEGTTNTTTFTNLTSGTHYYKVTVSADGYSSVTSDPITITVNKKAIASSVSLSADKSEIESGNTVTLTADVKEPAFTSGLTYTFTDTTTNTTKTETTNKSTFTLTTTGKHKFTVTVSAGDNYTTVEDTATVNVFAPAKEMYLYGDFDKTEKHKWNADFKDYKFEYVNGKYVLKDVPFTGSCDGKERDYAFFRIYVSDDEQYSSNAGADQKLENGVPAKIRKYNDKALKFKVPTSKKVNIEFDLENLQITVTEVVVQCKMNAKYQITDIGSPFQDAKADEKIATVNDGLTATGSTGLVRAVNNFEDANGNTYVFSKWVSESGTFADATSKQTTFTPNSDGDVIAQYKRQYKVTCTTPTNGKLTASATGPLAGDRYTITVKPDDGYELASLTVYLGDTATSGDNITPGVNNGTYTTTAVNNARYVATFTKKKVDYNYSNIRLVGHINDYVNWDSFDKGKTFDENGTLTFDITTRSSNSIGGNGQFRFMVKQSDGTYKTYGVETNVDVEMNKEYTPTMDKTAIYYLYTADVGNYTVTITSINSSGVPTFKVTKNASSSTYELMQSADQTSGKTTSLGHFDTTDDSKVLTKTLSLSAGTYNFYIKNGDAIYCSTQSGTLGSSYGMNRDFDNRVGCVQYKLSAGLYTVTYTIVDENYGTLKIDSVAKPLAESVTLSAAQTSVTAGRSTTITATLNNSAVPAGKTYTYKYYDSNGKSYTKTSESTSDSIVVTSSEVGTVTYYVTVSTDAPYEDPKYPGSTLSYADVSSEGTSVSYVAKSYYIAEVNDTTIGDRHALTQDFFEPKSNPVTLSFFNAESEISEDTVEVMTVDESKNKYCQIVTSNIEDSAVSTGIPTYKIICNEGAKDPVVYVKNGHIYAVASLGTGATSKTFESNETVTYYFAEPTWDTNKSNPSNDKDGNAKAGLRIKYWNNSVPTQNGFIDVTTPVASDGKEATETGDQNKIYVKNTDFVGGSGWSDWNAEVQTYFVYKVDLPVWATSFQFVTSGESTMETVNGVVKDTSIASMGLNPNRIYMFFEYNKTYYARGVVLDSSFWANDTTRKNNDVPTKNFKTNAVDYATGYNHAAINNDFNENLNKLYDSSYSNPLFFGYLEDKTTQVAGNKNFRIQDNLAMRINNDAYYASVQGLAGSKLSTTQNNKNGYAYLQTSDNAKVMPLFDYASLKDKKNVASNVASHVFEKLNFPFNESNYNGVTTYSYDSYTDKNREVSASKNDFEVTSYKNATVGTDNGVGFFPFEQFTDTSKTNTHKYGFGTEFDIDFYMSETGRLETTDGDGKDITFNFSGDDDVWVYVDGVLVLDLGGAHKASSGLINFSTMEVIYKAAVDSSDNINSRSANPKTSDGYAVDGDYVTTVNLAKLFAANGVEFNNTSSSKKHTLQMFYMERGSVDSNCSISFNLPQNTGLLVRNDVNFDSVNAGLKDITMGIANKDYFSYTIGNKIATDSDITNLKSTFGDSSIPDKATSFVQSSFATSKPQYPVYTTNNVIRRVINGKTYYLAVKYTGAGSPSSYYWKSLNSSSYLPLNDINYSLPDDFAMIEKDSTANGNNGTTAVSGRVKDGVFNLLFNESASFDSKTPSNTLLQVVQKDNLYNVNAGSEKVAMSRGTEQTDRKVKDYYTTSYTITDDKSQKNIGSRTRQVNAGDIVADDKSAVENAFYFADYSADKSDSSAMTVNFTNYVTTDKIKISKDLTDSSKINSDHFTFVVKLSNIFGDSSYADKQEYEGLTYDVYDKEHNTLKTTRTYGKSGVSITANEYAIISGVPVGTSYEVYEKTRSGYNFNKVTAAFESDNRDNSTDFEPTISSSTVTGTLPTITASGSSTEPTLHLTYTNEKVAFTISFKYYDREVKTGQVAHIATTPTVKNVSFADISKYKKGSDAEGYYYDFEQMIADAMDNINVDNVIDSYVAFPSQSKAENAIKNQFSYRDFDATTSTYKKYIEAYPKGNFSAHTDYYGRLQGSKDAKVSDGEDWVTYYNGNKKYATEETALQHTSEVTSISVWYFNTLKTYSPTFHFATAKEDLSQIGTSKYVANKKINTIKPVFYNVRLGIKNDDAKIDSQGTYLEQYGVNGFTDSYSGTSMSIKDNNEELKFLYWSYDAAGKSIASNSYKYGYRVTNNIHLYAIYGDKKDNTDPGLTVSMNSPDYYIDNNGINRVRLNTMMNVYNCPDSDQKIRQVSVIYIQDPNNNISNYIGDNNTEALKTVREKVKGLIEQHSKDAQFSGVTIKIEGHGTYDAKGLTYKVWNDDGSSLLTNKNRVQFTTSFKQELLGGAKYKNLYTFAAMNYKDSDSAKDNWLISDNYIKYTFNEVGKVTNGLTQVNSLQ